MIQAAGTRGPTANFRNLGPQQREARATVNLETFAEVMRTLGDETRIRILRALRNDALCVCDLAEAVGVSQPLVSHHLKALKAAGLVSCRKDGSWVYYAIRPETFQALGLQALWREGGVLGRDVADGVGPAQAPAPPPASSQ